MIFYIRAVNHSSMLCVFPMVVWLPGWLSGWQGARGGMCCGWTGRETGTGGCWVITWPRGCLFKPKSCLDYCTQTLLLYCSCMRHKGREMEIGGRKKQRGSRREKERVIVRRGRRRSGQCHPSFPGNSTNNQ